MRVLSTRAMVNDCEIRTPLAKHKLGKAGQQFDKWIHKKTRVRGDKTHKWF